MLPAQPYPRQDRVQHELRATGVRPEAANPRRSGIHTRGYLPHVKREGASYFVTFRQAGSLPKEVLLKIQSNRAERLHRLYAQQDAANKSCLAAPLVDSRKKIERDYFRELEAYLDQSGGECLLKRPDLADLVSDALRFFAGERYRLDAWVVMPNHVHVVFWPMPNYDVSGIVQTWKRFTAREINKILNRTGQPFWQPEPYDHWVRNEVEHARCCGYVVRNPVKAGLCATPKDWPWSSARK